MSKIKNVLFDDVEVNRYEALAKRRGMTFSELVRRSLMDVGATEELRHEISKLKSELMDLQRDFKVSIAQSRLELIADSRSNREQFKTVLDEVIEMLVRHNSEEIDKYRKDTKDAMKALVQAIPQQIQSVLGGTVELQRPGSGALHNRRVDPDTGEMIFGGG